MTDSEKVIEYEIQIADMLHAIQERLNELEGKELDDFQQGRHLAFTEMFEIINTRHGIIKELINED